MSPTVAVDSKTGMVSFVRTVITAPQIVIEAIHKMAVDQLRDGGVIDDLHDYFSEAIVDEVLTVWVNKDYLHDPDEVGVYVTKNLEEFERQGMDVFH